MPFGAHLAWANALGGEFRSCDLAASGALNCIVFAPMLRKWGMSQKGNQDKTDGIPQFT